MITLMGSVLLSFSYSGFTLMLFCRCVLSLPLGVSHFLRLVSLGQGAVLDRRLFLLLQIIFILYLLLKFCNRIQNSNCNKVQLSEHFIC
jgi:hypothetical protein